jgi:putative PIN family toxin of toxin-antitoxin system
MPTEGALPRLVVDTNLLVGHLFHPDARGPRVILARWREGSLRVCVSAEVLREVRSTLRRLPVSERRKQEILDLLEDPERTDLWDCVEDTGFRCGDPGDDKFLHLAVRANADAIITSDRALLEVERFPIPILKSGQWLRSEDR